MKIRSHADKGLAETIRRATGISVSGWRIERWRQHGLLAAANHIYPGEGSVAVYSPEALDQAIELARLSRLYKRYDELSRVLFYNGFHVEVAVLRKVYLRMLDRLEKWMGPVRNETDLDRLDAKAQRLAQYAKRTKVGRRVLHRLGRHQDETPEAVAAGAYFALMHVLKTGRPSSEEGLGDLFRAFGLNGLFEDRIGAAGPIAPNGAEELTGFLTELSFPNIRERLSTATIDEYREAADLIRTSIPFIRSVAIIATRVFPVPNAFGLAVLADSDPGALDLASFVPFALSIAPHARTEGARELLARMKETQGYFAEAAQFIASLPTPIVAALKSGDPGPLASLSNEQQTRIRETAGVLQLAGHRFDLGS